MEQNPLYPYSHSTGRLVVGHKVLGTAARDEKRKLRALVYSRHACALEFFNPRPVIQVPLARRDHLSPFREETQVGSFPTLPLLVPKPVRGSISVNVFYTNLNTSLGIRMGAKIKEHAQKSLVRGPGGALSWRARPPRAAPRRCCFRARRVRKRRLCPSWIHNDSNYSSGRLSRRVTFSLPISMPYVYLPSHDHGFYQSNSLRAKTCQFS